MKRCRKCGRLWDISFFNRNTARRSRNCGLTRQTANQQITRADCRRCEQNAKDEAKSKNRVKVKAEQTLRRHAARLNISPALLRDKYGWDLKRMMYDIQHAFENTCTYCERSYADMKHGLQDVTLDIVDRSKEPWYKTNIKWCCNTCNSSKSTMSPEEWSINLQCWAQCRRDDETGRILMPIPEPPKASGQPTLFELD